MAAKVESSIDAPIKALSTKAWNQPRASSADIWPWVAERTAPDRLATVGLGLCFVLGFATVFVAMGAGASALAETAQKEAGR